MKVLIAAVAACLLATPALAVTKVQKKNALHHVAQVAAIVTRCSREEADDARIGVLAALFGLDLGGRDKVALERDALEQIDSVKASDEETICLIGLMLYGENGANVPKLIREK